jgi:hypothetical protein
VNGGCACGAVRVEVATAPDHVAICNCGLCRPLGAAWAYYAPEHVHVAGSTRTFQRDDIAEPWLTVHFCPNCGTATHYLPTRSARLDRMAVNSRLFREEELDGVPAIWQDGRAVETEHDAFITTGTGRIGDGKAF